MNRFMNMGLVALSLLAFVSGCKSSKSVATATVAEATEAVAQPVAVTTAETGSSLLWEISGNGLEKPSYLFGTIHLIGSDDFIFPDMWNSAFNQTEHLMLELDMDDPGMMMKMMSGSMMENGQSLKDLVSAEDYDAIKAFFKDSLNQPIAIMGKMKPMLLTSSMYTKMINGDPVAYEMVLTEKAKEREIEVSGVEAVEDQLEMIGNISMDDQLEMLMGFIDDFDGQKSQFQDLIDTYVTQDIFALYELMTETEEMDAEMQEVMLDGRNRKWIPVIEEQAAAMPTFFAFGAGHLPGENGVISLLKAEGYTVKPVR